MGPIQAPPAQPSAAEHPNGAPAPVKVDPPACLGGEGHGGQHGHHQGGHPAGDELGQQAPVQAAAALQQAHTHNRAHRGVGGAAAKGVGGRYEGGTDMPACLPGAAFCRRGAQLPKGAALHCVYSRHGEVEAGGQDDDRGGGNLHGEAAGVGELGQPAGKSEGGAGGGGPYERVSTAAGQGGVAFQDPFHSSVAGPLCSTVMRAAPAPDAHRAHHLVAKQRQACRNDGGLGGWGVGWEGVGKPRTMSKRSMGKRD